MCIRDSFKDVPAGTWYTKSVLGAAAAGILLGTDVDKASPGDRITREQAFTLMGRALMVKENEAGTAAYSDAAEISKYAKGYIGGMTAAGILHGSNGKCSPKSNITRAEVITVVDNAIGAVSYTHLNRLPPSNSTAETFLHQRNAQLPSFVMPAPMTIFVIWS